MKRSEILKIIMDEIDLMRGVDNGYYVYPEDKQIADRILNVLEEAGMNPPYDTASDDDDPIYEWEPEYET
jgi:hypothetical protein